MVKQRKTGARKFVADLFDGSRTFLNNRNYRSAVSLAEAYPATVVAAILAGKTLLAGMLFRTPFRGLRNVHFALQSGNCYKGHD